VIVTFATRVNVREYPSISAKILKVAEKDSIAIAYSYATEAANGHIWRQLTHADGIVGWSAQGTGSPLYYLELAEFEQAVEFTLAWENGYTNNPDDPGGETKYGISKRSYPTLDIFNLTLEQAKAIYYRDYWVKSEAYKYGYPKNLIIFDIAVLSGVGRAKEYAEMEPFNILVSQLEFYSSLTNFTLFGRGWTRRTIALLRLL
jgi:hypothetical protein